MEQHAIAASRIANQFFAESSTACGADSEKVERVLPELVDRVLAWVAERRGKSTRSQATTAEQSP